ncbi:MAG: SH3 domain-containing protein [Acidovorax sp.]|uniref:SH3 domain-containing protein n=1 Tax=Acidovorax sp. TaxID=1872122 RepID=UPI0039E51C87
MSIARTFHGLPAPSRRGLVAAALLAFGLSSAQAQTHQVSTATELRAAPALNARPLAKLVVGVPLTETGQQGGWLKVQSTGNPEGWVRLTHVKSLAAAQPAAAKGSANPLTGLGGVFTAASTKPTATTGTRGLTQEQLANAQPNLDEVQQLERYASNAAQAQQFARGGKLNAQKINGYEGN